MSDVLLTEISKKLSDIHTALTKGAGGGTPGATKPPAVGGSTPGDPAAAAAAKTKATADAAAKAAAAAAAKLASAPKAAGATVSGTKAPNGKYTVDQVRDKIKEVASNPNLGKASAVDILDQDGGGVKSVRDLKPENYDKVYEACQVALQSEGQTATPAIDDDLM